MMEDNYSHDSTGRAGTRCHSRNILLGVLSDDRVLVTTEWGMLDVTWSNKQLKKMPSQEMRFTNIAVTPNGTVYGHLLAATLKASSKSESTSQ